MPRMDGQDIRAARGAAGRVARSVQGWMFGAALVLLGVLVGLWTGGDVRAEVASSPHQGTFSVQSCASAPGGGYDCGGSFAPETGEAHEEGTLHAPRSRAPGEHVRVEESSTDYTRNTYREIPANRLGGRVLVLGLAVAALAAGVFSLLTGYCPRPLYDGYGRWANAYHDRRRVTFTQGWARFPARRLVAPALAVVAALGLVTAAVGGVLLALA